MCSVGCSRDPGEGANRTDGAWERGGHAGDSAATVSAWLTQRWEFPDSSDRFDADMLHPPCHFRFMGWQIQ